MAPRDSELDSSSTSTSSSLKYPRPPRKAQAMQAGLAHPSSVTVALTLLRAARSRSRLASWSRVTELTVSSFRLLRQRGGRLRKKKSRRSPPQEKIEEVASEMMTASMTRWFNSPPTSLQHVFSPCPRPPPPQAMTSPFPLTSTSDTTAPYRW